MGILFSVLFYILEVNTTIISMLMLSKYQIALAEGDGSADSQMIWSLVLIAIVVLLMVFGRRILLLVKGKSADEDLDEDEFVVEEEEDSKG